MKAAIYFGPKDIRCSDVPDARLDSGLEHALLVRVIGTSICGSDLHLYSGAFDQMMEAGVSQTGHELVGEVVEVGQSVARFNKGDRVTMAYSCSCGDCYMCSVGQTAHCETTQKAVYGFGSAFGSLNGSHAEAMVIPYADAHAMKVSPNVSDEAAVTLSCNLPTALIANKLAGVEPGENVALVGCGPTGLMALEILLSAGRASQIYALDPVPHRRELAVNMGAQGVDTSREGVVETLKDATDGRGFDKVIEMVGSRDSLQLSLDLIRPGGTVAALGVFPDDSFNLVLADVFLRDISLHMNGFANVQPFMWESARLVERGVANPERFFTNQFSLDEVDQAFATFDRKDNGANKVLIRP